MRYAPDDARFMRHHLLPEVGKAGQEKLCAAVVAILPDVESHAANVIRDYLTRAGVQIAHENASDITHRIDRPTQTEITQLADSLSSFEAAAVCAGSTTAIQSIKSICDSMRMAE